MNIKQNVRIFIIIIAQKVCTGAIPINKSSIVAIPDSRPIVDASTINELKEVKGSIDGLAKAGL
jgi:hypothetical protein